jgi:hypothetical protein
MNHAPAAADPLAHLGRQLVQTIVAILETDTELARRARAAMEGAPIASAAPATSLPVVETEPPTQPRRGEGVPLGMTIYVKARDVMAALGCSKSKAYEELRKAAGRTVGTHACLRVTVEDWERYRREVEEGVDTWRRGDRRGTTSGSAGGSSTRPSTSTASAPSGARGARTARRLGPFSPPGSVMPLIPLQRDRSR